MNKMTIQELVAELNEFAKNAELQTEDNIVQLYFHYKDMFDQYCHVVPNFEIVDNKGTIELSRPEFK